MATKSLKNEETTMIWIVLITKLNVENFIYNHELIINLSSYLNQIPRQTLDQRLTQKEQTWN